MAARSPAESIAALSFGDYLAARHAREQEVLSLQGHALDEVDLIVGAFPVGVHGRTEALLADYLTANDMQDYDERAVSVTERVFQQGLRLRAVTASLGNAGMRLVAVDPGGKRHKIGVEYPWDGERIAHLKENSVLGSLVDAAMAGFEEQTADVYEMAELLGNPAGKLSVSRRMVGMRAIHVAELEQAVGVIGAEEVDVLNQGAQLYCMLTRLQQTATLRMYLRDKEMYAVPLPDDLNGLALTDNARWLEVSGPVVKLK